MLGYTHAPSLVVSSRVSGTGDEDFPDYLERRKSDSSGDSSSNMDPISHTIGFEFPDAT